MPEWISFARAVEDFNYVVTSVQSLPREFRTARPHVGVVNFPFVEDSHGRPSVSELDRICALEDRLVKAIGGEECRLGHIIGIRRIQTAVASTKPEPVEVRLKSGHFKSTAFAIDWSNDGWAWYERNLAATNLEMAHACYRELHATLQKQGDVATVSRPVDFAFFSPNAESRAQLLDLLALKGFRVTESRDPEQPGGDYFVELAFETTLVQSEMDALCSWLLDVSEATGVTFDGWATPICRPPANG
jgi:hypothetical protein